MTTTITLTIDEHVQDDLKDVLKYLRYQAGFRGVPDIDTEQKTQKLIIVAIELAAILACFEYNFPSRISTTIQEAFDAQDRKDDIPRIRDPHMMRTFRPNGEHRDD